MPLNIVRTLLAGVLTIGTAVPAAAQADPISSAAFRIGPVGFTPSFTVPSIGVESNVFLTTEDPKEDFVANLQPQLEVWARAGRLRLAARQQLNAIYYRRYESERSLNTQSFLRADLLLNRVTLYGSGAYVKTNEQPSPEINTRVDSISIPVTGGLILRAGSKTTLDVTVDSTKFEFEEGVVFLGDPVAEALDRNNTVYRGRLSYALSGPTAVTFNAAHEVAQFAQDANRDNTNLTIMPGLSFAPFALISGSAEVGVMRFTPRDPEFRPFTGLAARVDLGYVLLGRTRLTLQLIREARPSVEVNQNYFVQTGMTTAITHRFTERWDVTAKRNGQSLAYFGILGPDDGDGSESLETYNASIGFSLNRGLRLALGAEKMQRISSRLRASFENVRLAATFSFGFQ